MNFKLIEIMMISKYLNFKISKLTVNKRALYSKERFSIVSRTSDGNMTLLILTT